jgi:hypothetical protein
MFVLAGQSRDSRERREAERTGLSKRDLVPYGWTRDLDPSERGESALWNACGSSHSTLRARAKIGSRSAAGPQARRQGASDEHTRGGMWSEQRSRRACGPQPEGRGAGLHFIGNFLREPQGSGV